MVFVSVLAVITWRQQWLISAPERRHAMRHRISILAGSAVVGLLLAACGSSSGGSGSAASSSPAASPHASGQSVVKTGKAGGATVLTNASGMTLYWFAPDTSSKSNCNGSCAQIWPPLRGAATAGQGVHGSLGTIKRSSGGTQATYNGRPLYTYTADSSPGQAKGNGINTFGGVWHDITTSGSAASNASPTGGGGY
jgi:predicted lipoprotein with Yx(FWY)xxD motif